MYYDKAFIDVTMSDNKEALHVMVLPFQIPAEKYILLLGIKIIKFGIQPCAFSLIPLSSLRSPTEYNKTNY